MVTEPFEARVAAMKRWFDKKGQEGAPYARLVAHTKCKGEDHLVAELARIEKRGGEGVMLRQPGSRYVGARYLAGLSVFNAETMSRVRVSACECVDHTSSRRATDCDTDRARCSR
jgi:hypothetical protein